MTVVSLRTFLEIIAIFCVPMVPKVVGRGLSLPNYFCQTFWYTIVATRGPLRSSELLFCHVGGVGANIFGDFCNILHPYGTLSGW